MIADVEESYSRDHVNNNDVLGNFAVRQLVETVAGCGRIDDIHTRIYFIASGQSCCVQHYNLFLKGHVFRFSIALHTTDTRRVVCLSRMDRHPVIILSLDSRECMRMSPLLCLVSQHDQSIIVFRSVPREFCITTRLATSWRV